MIRKVKKNYKFLNLCGLSTESFLAIWPSQVQVSYKRVSYKKVCILIATGLLREMFTFFSLLGIGKILRNLNIFELHIS